MNAHLLADRVSNIVVGGALVRIDLGCLAPPNPQQKSPTFTTQPDAVLCP